MLDLVCHACHYILLYYTGSYAGAVVGMPLSGILTKHFGWPTGFYVFGRYICRLADMSYSHSLSKKKWCGFLLFARLIVFEIVTYHRFRRTSTLTNNKKIIRLHFSILVQL